jgi:hypothetical protein
MIDPRSGAAKARAATIGAAGALGLSMIAALAPCAANADVILSVSGPANTGETLSANQAAAAAFSLAGTVSDVTITATVSCVSCLGGIWLNENEIGPGTPNSDTLFGESFPGTTSVTLSSLAAATYFLVFSVESGDVAWEGSNPPTVTSIDGASAAGDFLATSCTDPLAPLCNFSSVFGVGLNFTVTGTPISPAVPEPGSLALFATALGGLGIAAYHRKKPKASR